MAPLPPPAPNANPNGNPDPYPEPDPELARAAAAFGARAGRTAREEDLRDHYRGRIAHFKVPRYIRLVESFPMTVTGKVQKFIMREQMMTEFGLQVARTA